MTGVLIVGTNNSKLQILNAKMYLYIKFDLKILVKSRFRHTVHCKSIFHSFNLSLTGLVHKDFFVSRTTVS